MANLELRSLPLESEGTPIGVKSDGSAIRLNGRNKVLQTLFVEQSDELTTTSIIPKTDDLPTIAQGVEIMSVDITPQSQSSALIFAISVYGSEGEINTGNDYNRNSNIVFPLFKDDVLIAVGVMSTTSGDAGNNSNWASLSFNVKHQQGDVNTSTYSLRGGCNHGGFNHLSSTRDVGQAAGNSNSHYGSKTSSTMVIQEVAI